MKSFKKFLNERRGVRVYHGGGVTLKELEPKWMMHDNSNNQEGVGIYFGETVEIAQAYGPKIVFIDIEPKYFVDPRESAGKHLRADQLSRLIIKALGANSSLREDIFYWVSDYVEIVEPEDLNDDNIEEACGYMLDEEIRNVQVEFAEMLGTELFVELWNKYIPKIHGLYNKHEGFYSVIHTSYAVCPYYG